MLSSGPRIHWLRAVPQIINSQRKNWSIVVMKKTFLESAWITWVKKLGNLCQKLQRKPRWYICFNSWRKRWKNYWSWSWRKPEAIFWETFGGSFREAFRKNLWSNHCRNLWIYFRNKSWKILWRIVFLTNSWISLWRKQSMSQFRRIPGVMIWRKAEKTFRRNPWKNFWSMS